jgi:decaprenylphospho-beta-D-erythro-pentofuranosid-2-ulose 2-reductase
MRRILIVGATSAIAEATARLFAQAGDQLFLAARDGAKLRILGDDLRARGPGRWSCSNWTCSTMPSMPVLLEQAFARLGGLDCC